LHNRLSCLKEFLSIPCCYRSMSFLSFLRRKTMTKNVARAVRDDVSAQMRLIEEMARELQNLYEIAERDKNESLRQLVQKMAHNLRNLSEKAYDVGERVLEAA
jgi:signal transduction histidine kinase